MKLPLLVAAIGIGLSSQACSQGPGEDESDDVESEPEAVSGADSSRVDCTITAATAYSHGKAFSIDLIRIGGKPTSLETGHAFLAMQAAARDAGVTLRISSGFRTMAEQQYLYRCYQTGRCNHGNLAARPGYSNHQSGRALDLSTSTWLARNAASFGFERTVPSEPWHYEYVDEDLVDGPCAVEPAATSGDDGPSAADDTGR